MSETTDIDFYGKGDPIMDSMFGACVRWAWRNPEARQSFERETGMRLAESPVNIVIDRATGYEDAVMESFVRWVAVNVWGEED